MIYIFLAIFVLSIDLYFVSSAELNRTLSGILTNPAFKNILQTGNGNPVSEKIRKYNTALSLAENSTVRDAIKNLYLHLSKNYRNEYIYKNTIVNKILLGRHSLNTATLLSEYRVGTSIADLVLLNGTSTVYEIKTELDSPDKLHKQIEDYQKAFCKLYIVTHHTLVSRYSQMLADSPVGLITLNSRLQLSTVKEAEENHNSLDMSVMMRCLRKDEYSSIIKQYYGSVPNVSNIQLFTTCLNLAQNIPVKTFHDLMVKELKKRTPNEKDSLSSDNLPPELRHICLCINPTKQQYSYLFNFLNQNI